MPLDACGHLLCNMSVESSGSGPRQMASHLGNASARNDNSQLTWIEIYMLSAAIALGIFLEKVKLVENTTLDNHGLEGAFLMSDHNTPTFCMWGFKFNKPMKMCNGIFNPTHPFRDPSVLQHQGHLSHEDICETRAKNGENAFLLRVAKRKCDLKTNWMRPAPTRMIG